MRKIFAVALLLLFLHGAYAETGLQYNVQLGIELEKNSLESGGSLKGNFSAANFEGVALNDAFIIAEIVSGGKDSLQYPSQFGDEGVIFSEERFEANVSAKGQRKIPFEIALPENLAAGTYTLDAYLVNGRTPAVGVAHIFSSPVSVEFEVKAPTQNNFPFLNIVRTKTVFNNVAGPVGPPVEAGGEIPGKIFIRNDSSADAKNITLRVLLCDWDDTMCPTILSQASKKISVPAGAEVSESVLLRAPGLPGAYAIRIELLDDKGKMIALYRNRSIVAGATAKIRRLDVSAQKLEAGKEAKVSLLLGVSPDHYNDPDFADFDVKAWAESRGAEIFSKTERVALLRFEEGSRPFEFAFTPQGNYDSFTVCSSVEKGGTEMDIYCFDVEGAGEEVKVPGKGMIDVKDSYNAASGIFSLEVCGFGAGKNPESLDILYTLVDKGSNSKVRSSRIENKECFSDSVRVNESKHLLLVDDFRNKSQFNKELDFSAAAGAAPSCNDSGGIICSEGQVCSGDIVEGFEGGCCRGVCESRQPVRIDEGQGFNAPDISAIALVLLVILAAGALIYYKKAKNSGGGKQ